MNRESQPRGEKRRDLKNPPRLTGVWAVFERTHAQQRRQRHARPKADRTNGAASARAPDEGWMQRVRGSLLLILLLPVGVYSVCSEWKTWAILALDLSADTALFKL